MAKRELKAWADDVALIGPDAPKWNGQIEHLIEYLLTVYERFGNTAITTDCKLQWGASALHKRDEQKERILSLESTNQTLAQANVTLAVRIEALEAELRAAKGDAERYRLFQRLVDTDQLPAHIKESIRRSDGNALDMELDTLLAAAPQSAQTRGERE